MLGIMVNKNRPSGILCAVPTCKASKRTHPDRSFFSFPSDQKLYEVWLEKCALGAKTSVRRLKVCEKHFDKRRIKNKRLLKKSIPEYYLISDPIMESIVELYHENEETTSTQVTIDPKMSTNNVSHIESITMSSNNSFSSLNSNLYKKKYVASLNSMRSLTTKIKRYMQMIKYYKKQINFFKTEISNCQVTKSIHTQIDLLPNLSSTTKEIAKMILDDPIKDWPCMKCIEILNVRKQLKYETSTTEVLPTSSIKLENDDSHTYELAGENVESNEYRELDLEIVKKTSADSQEKIEQTISDKISYECEKCSIKLISYEQLICHMRRHRDLMLYECEICGKEFHWASKYRYHSIMHKIDSPFKCKICQKGFKGLKNLKQHELTHKTEKIFACPHCDKWFCHDKGLKQHLLCHRQKHIACNSCSRKFQFKSQLTYHMEQAHRGENRKNILMTKQFTCEICGKLISGTTNFKNHIKNIHKNSQKPFSCSFCSKSFNTNLALTSHIQCHINSKNCPLDPKTKESYLQFKCDECDKGFTTATFLKKHKIIHSGVKKFICEYCNKGFAFKMYLERHIRLLHDTTNPKNVICGVCGKVSVDASNFKMHMLAHTGEMPFPCNICDLKFRYAKSLRIHMKNKHLHEVKIE